MRSPGTEGKESSWHVSLMGGGGGQKPARLVVTRSGVNLCDRKSCLREIGFSELEALTISSKNERELVFHVRDDADERLAVVDGEARDQLIVRVMQGKLAETSAEKMAIYEVRGSSLRQYATTEEDLEQGVLLRPERATLRNYSISDFTRRTSELARTRTGSEGGKVGEFELLKLLGRGAHGKVFLCRRKGDSELLAMKVLRKRRIIETESLERTKVEKKILGGAKHPFTVSLVEAFQTPEKVYFVMEFMQGGELFSHLRRRGRFREQEARFIIACLVLAVGHLHQADYIYRDLKPENVLFDLRGYAKLADFGLAKALKQGDVAKSFCGTPAYMPPELILRKGCSRPADWWALGCLAFEVLVGKPPFYHPDPQLSYRATVASELKIPNLGLSEPCVDFLRRLLEKDPTRRLGSGADLLEVMSHPWLSEIDWRLLLNQQLTPPYKPLQDEAAWTSNFDQEAATQPVSDSICYLDSSFLEQHKHKFETLDQPDETLPSNQLSNRLPPLIEDPILSSTESDHSSCNPQPNNHTQAEDLIVSSTESEISTSHPKAKLADTPPPKNRALSPKKPQKITAFSPGAKKEAEVSRKLFDSDFE